MCFIVSEVLQCLHVGLSCLVMRCTCVSREWPILKRHSTTSSLLVFRLLDGHSTTVCFISRSFLSVVLSQDSCHFARTRFFVYKCKSWSVDVCTYCWFRLVAIFSSLSAVEFCPMSSCPGSQSMVICVKGEMARMSNGHNSVSAGRNRGNIEVTNDRATILKSVGFDNPAAKILVNMSKVQDDEVGNGTTSVTVLAAELLREAERLIERKIHPQIIIEGYRRATAAALAALDKSAVDNSADDNVFRDDLLNIARNALSSKILNLHQEKFSKLAVDAVLRLKGSGNLCAIQIIKKTGGSLDDSFLDDGFLLDKKIGQFQPKRVENAIILIANTPMDTDKIKMFWIPYSCRFFGQSS